MDYPEYEEYEELKRRLAAQIEAEQKERLRGLDAEKVRARVAEIEIAAQGRDHETAHSLEDELHQDVLRVIADGAANSQELAGEALKTLELDFSRWYA